MNSNYKMYLKYRQKYLKIKQSGGCELIRFPDWIISMSKKYPESVDYTLFYAVPESIYSSELPFHIAPWIRLLKNEVVKDTTTATTALNMTANIGAFDINAANYFNNLSIDAVEIGRCPFTALERNIDSFKLGKQIHAVLDDSIDYIDNTSKHYDFVYMDPPWGGPGYKKSSDLKLKLSGVDVHDVVNRIFDKKISGVVLLKAPTNFHLRLGGRYKVKPYIFRTSSNKVSYVVYVIRSKV